MALSVKSPVLIPMILAVLLDIIAVSIPYWMRRPPSYHAGLWKVCAPTCVYMTEEHVNDIIAVSIPYWMSIPAPFHAGLWKICAPKCHYMKEHVSDTILTFRGLHMFALVVGIASLIVYIVAEVRELLDLKKRRILCAVLTLVAGAFILIGDCYIATKFLIHPACFSLSLIAAFFFIFVGGNLSSHVNSGD